MSTYQQSMRQSNVSPNSGSQFNRSPNYEHQITSSHTHVNRPTNVIYGPHTFHAPSNESVDRLAQFVRQEQATRSQSSKHRKVNEDDEINYINDRNQKFNQKIARAYDQHTEDIRESFERGTAL
jgi:pre-mRNA-splicing factor SYF2